MRRKCLMALHLMTPGVCLLAAGGQVPECEQADGVVAGAAADRGSDQDLVPESAHQVEEAGDLAAASDPAARPAAAVHGPGAVPLSVCAPDVGRPPRGSNTDWRPESASTEDVQPSQGKSGRLAWRLIYQTLLPERHHLVIYWIDQKQGVSMVYVLVMCIRCSRIDTQILLFNKE